MQNYRVKTTHKHPTGRLISKQCHNLFWMNIVEATSLPILINCICNLGKHVLERRQESKNGWSKRRPGLRHDRPSICICTNNAGRIQNKVPLQTLLRRSWSIDRLIDWLDCWIFPAISRQLSLDERESCLILCLQTRKMNSTNCRLRQSFKSVTSLTTSLSIFFFFFFFLSCPPSSSWRFWHYFRVSGLLLYVGGLPGTSWN